MNDITYSQQITQRHGPLLDIFVAIFLLFFISSAQVPGWDLSPIALLTPIGFAYLVFTKRWIPRYFSKEDRRAFWGFCFLIAYNLFSLVMFKSNIGSFIISVSILVAGGFIIYYGCYPKLLERFIIIFFCILFLSLILFIVSTYSSGIANRLESILSMRDRADRLVPKGLARASFTFGYQMSALWLFLMYKYSNFKGNNVGRLLIMLAIAATSWALYIQGTRSGVFSILVALLALIISAPGTRRLIMPWLIFSCAGYLFINIASSGWLDQSKSADWFQSRGSVIERFQNEDDLEVRFGMQLAALDIIIQNPFGLRAAGKNWDTEIYQQTNLFSTSESVVAVHNAFLGYMLENGIFAGLLLLAILFYCIKIALQMLRLCGSENTIISNTAIIPMCFIADQCNALFHNACFINEPFSAALFFLLIAQNSFINIE